jgi:hypothetical protein
MNKITRRDFMRKAGGATALSYGYGLGARPLAARGASGAGEDAAAKPTWRREGDLWIGGNASLEIAVSTRTGTIERLIDKISREDYCHQATEDAHWPSALGAPYEVAPRIGGLILIDELRNKRFSDLESDCAIAAPEIKTTPASVAFSFRKKYPLAEFTVWQTFRVAADHLRWDVRIKKDAGPERTVRVIQVAPLPLPDDEGWAPIAEAPFAVKPYLPFAIEYGQSTAGSVGEPEWRTNIPMTVFYSREKNRAICFTAPLEIPAVRIRFLNNTSAEADFHWNSRLYPQRERPYFQVSHEYLGIRNQRDLEAGLLISVHPADWRPALGWVYSQYQEYFDPQPGFDEWDGVYASGGEWMKDSLTEADVNTAYAGLRDRGNRWEELHGHFPWYGLMVPEPSVKSWSFVESHPNPGTTLTREKIAAHARLAREFGVGTFIYYNTTEAEHGYAQQAFPDSIARAESGKPLGAWRATEYPDPRACYLMNADPTSSFGKHMTQQAEAMVGAYPAIAGFFWDVYGRSYLFDFAHDDGITMMVSAWRHLRKVDNSDANLEVICRLPDADRMKNIRATAIDLEQSWPLQPTRNGDTLKLVIPQHGKATVILLAP